MKSETQLTADPNEPTVTSRRPLQAVVGVFRVLFDQTERVEGWARRLLHDPVSPNPTHSAAYRRQASLARCRSSRRKPETGRDGHPTPVLRGSPQCRP